MNDFWAAIVGLLPMARRDTNSLASLDARLREDIGLCFMLDGNSRAVHKGA